MAHKILVVDDEPFMVRLIQHHLERAGYELIKARTTEEAQVAIAEQVPQLVLLNEKANESTAVPATAATIPAAPSTIPVIRMTDVPATMPKQTPEISEEIVFRKPFSPTKLLEEVRRLLTKTPPDSIPKT